MPIVRELRRRRVFRTAALYVVAAWVLLQVADLAFPALDIADEAIRFVWAGVILGFPIAVIFGWRYQVTSHGIEKTQPLAAGQSPGDLGLKGLDFGLLAALSLVLVVIAFGVVREIRQSDRPGVSVSGREIPPNSIAVLPLDNLTGDPEQRYFTIGLQEALISDLAGISGLRVTSRTSSRMYENVRKTAVEIGLELGVAYVIEGTVQRVGDSVRVRLQLINAALDELLWSENYDREARDILVLQGEIARTVAGEVGVKLTTDERSRLTRRREVNPDVYELLVKGMYFAKQFSPEAIEKGFEFLNEAIDVDPRQSLAYAGLALGYNTIGHGINAHDAFPRARAAALKALEIDEYSGEGWAALAEAQMYYDWDWETSKSSMLKALQLSPSLDQMHAHYAYLLVLYGRMEEGIAAAEKARDLSPLDPLWAGFAAWIYMLEDRWEEAEQGADECISLDPGFTFCHYAYAHVLTAQGRYDEAVKILESVALDNSFILWSLPPTYAMAGRRDDAMKLVAILDQDHTPRNLMHIAFTYSALGELDEAIQYLELAYDARADWLPWIAFKNAYGGAVEPMRDDPRFRDIVARMKLPK